MRQALLRSAGTIQMCVELLALPIQIGDRGFDALGLFLEAVGMKRPSHIGKTLGD